MSTFSTKGGLYERAQRKFKLQDGKTLFTYSFYDRNRLEALAFFADIYLEATRATAAPGHHALAELQRAGRLQRHYTLNIDGLAEKVGMNTWHPENNPDGCTVEMHGNVHHLVCVECGECSPLTAEKIRDMKACKEIPCLKCPTSNNNINNLERKEEREEDEKEEDDGKTAAAAATDTAPENINNNTKPPLRFKVMLYEDAESEVITPEEVMDLMEEDTKAADLILWVGISFQQSASTAYFRKVRHWLQEAGKSEDVVQAVINPSDEALWNLMTASSNQRT
jgi:NAD-dependent SIR2 family protein deacetylase